MWAPAAKAHKRPTIGTPGLAWHVLLIHNAPVNPSSSTLRGFILQATYRVQDIDGVPVPVIHLHGRLEDGRSFLVRDRRPRPHFYIRQRDSARAQMGFGVVSEAVDWHSFDGDPVARITVRIPSDVPPLRERLHDAGIDTFEADVRFAMRYLIQRGIKGGVSIEGAITGTHHGMLVFDEPQLRPAQVSLDLRVLAFDIETDAKAQRLLAIAMYSPDVDEVLVVDGSGRPMPPQAIACKDEAHALQLFCQRIRQLDPDVITGWNCIDFDLTVLQRVAARTGQRLAMGRTAGELRIRSSPGFFASAQASIPGRVVLDGIDLLRGAFIRMEDHSLDAVARQVLGEGKSHHQDSGAQQVAQIIHNYRHDLPAFVLYARTDARLAWQIVQQLSLVELAMARSQLTGMTPDRVSASIASFDFLYLSELRRRQVVARTLRSDIRTAAVAQAGGHVLASEAGLYRNVWVFDFRSLYPSLMRTFNIDPLAYVPVPAEQDDLIRTPAGAFRREPAILPQLLDVLFPQREAAIERGDKVASNAIKILMNSCYGVLGTPACRFHEPALANAITGLGRQLLQWSQRWFEGCGYQVLYGDTDSLFVRSGIESPQQAEQTAQTLVQRFNHELAEYIAAQWRVPSRLQLKFEKLYLKLFLPTVRNSTRGASKRYAGLLSGGVQLVGMEAVRGDWTALARQVQRELYLRLFTDQPVEQYLADIVARLRAGEFDDQLVYSKNLRKDASKYTASAPHVVAARLSRSPLGRRIRYVMTVAGAQPLDNISQPLDREHYVTRQVQPVAEPVLACLGLRFADVVGDRRQFELL